MSMGEEIVSTYLRTKMSSILEDAEADPGSPSYIVSHFRSIEKQIESSAWAVPADLLYELIEALWECRVFSYERPITAVSKKGFFFYLFLRIHHSVSEFMFSRRMRKRLNAIGKKLGTPSPAADSTRAPAGLIIEQTYPIRDSSLIIGFEAQVDQIEAWLMPRPRPSTSNKEEEIEEEEEEEERRDIGIGIVGEWGCGKTALAQKVFASPRIEEEFWPRIWVCVSNIKLDDEHVDLNYILKKAWPELSELEGKRYLIVLDDARQLPRESLYDCFPKGSGGAVIVTSRQENVVTHMFDDDKYVICLEPGHLSDEICWQIFSKQVQLQWEMDPNHLPSTIQCNVKTKFKGQPLAAKTLANTLPDLLTYWIPARDLTIAWGDDAGYWGWTPLPPPEEMEEVAELLSVCWLEIKGSLELNEMALKTSYSAYLVFKLKNECYLGNETTARVWIVSDGKDAKGVQELERQALIFKKNIQGEEGGYFPQAGGTGWMEIKLGEFFRGEGEGEGDGRLVEAIIEEKSGSWKYGLIVKGIDFRPKIGKKETF